MTRIRGASNSSKVCLRGTSEGFGFDDGAVEAPLSMTVLSPREFGVRASVDAFLAPTLALLVTFSLSFVASACSSAR